MRRQDSEPNEFGSGQRVSPEHLRSCSEGAIGTPKMITGVALAMALLASMPAVGLRAQQESSHRTSANVNHDNTWSELTASIERMHVDMDLIRPSGNSDVDFVRLMLPHHQAAIDMAKTQLLSGKDPQMRRLAQEIITDQQSEIQLMELWLKQHNPGSAKGDAVGDGGGASK